MTERGQRKVYQLSRESWVRTAGDLGAAATGWYRSRAMVRARILAWAASLRKGEGRNPSIGGVASTSADERRAGVPWGFVLLVLLALTGGVLERTGLLDWRAAVALAQGYAGQWWLAPAMAVVMAVLYSFGLPGSLITWVAGIVFPPLIAAPTVVLGGVAGALGAYSLARVARTSRDGGSGGERRRLVRLLARRSDFATLAAFRLAPGFPHSAINFAAGMLRVPVGRFAAASACGMAVKGTIYVSAIHQATKVAALDQAISWRTAATLSGLALVLVALPPLLRFARGRVGVDGAPVEPA